MVTFLTLKYVYSSNVCISYKFYGVINTSYFDFIILKV